MKTMLCAALTVGALFCHLSAQGVVITLAVKDLKTNQQLPEDQFFAKDGSLRIQTQQNGRPMTMIFSGGDFIYQDDQKKTFFRMNKESAVQSGAQVQEQMGDVQKQMAEAMKKMEAELDKLDPKQKAMIENLMKGGLAGAQPGAGGASEKPPQAQTRRVEAEGSGRVGGIDCMTYSVYRGDQLTRKICAAEAGDVDGGELAIEGFRNMSEAMQEIIQSFGEGLMTGMGDNGFELMKEMGDRFPVSMVEFANGQPIREAVYQSSVVQDLSDDLFTPCQDCQEQDPFQGGMGRAGRRK